MTAPNGNGRILDHLGRKPTNKELADSTIEAAQQMAAKVAVEKVDEVVQWYFAQLPELIAGIVAKMMVQGFEANGMEFKPPAPPPVVEE